MIDVTLVVSAQLARNSDRSWWDRHTNLKLFFPQSMAPRTTGQDTGSKKYILRVTTNLNCRENNIPNKSISLYK